MKMYNNNFADLDKLQNNGAVLVAKSNAECFLLTCKLADVQVKFELSDKKILFTLKKNIMKIALKTGLVYLDGKISGYYKKVNGKYSAYLKNADVKIRCFAFNKKTLKECINECIQEEKPFLNAVF